ncbi:hypothetical protein MLGJGCBP_07907 [Rhodococcus sp. T7]|nr:hypothetical protein MLGJGCBP_07907 [Rhodococcus sp. T7]
MAAPIPHGGGDGARAGCHEFLGAGAIPGAGLLRSRRAVLGLVSTGLVSTGHGAGLVTGRVVGGPLGVGAVVGVGSVGVAAGVRLG